MCYLSKVNFHLNHKVNENIVLQIGLMPVGYEVLHKQNPIDLLLHMSVFD